MRGATGDRLTERDESRLAASRAGDGQGGVGAAEVASLAFKVVSEHERSGAGGAGAAGRRFQGVRGRRQHHELIGRECLIAGLGSLHRSRRRTPARRCSRTVAGPSIP